MLWYFSRLNNPRSKACPAFPCVSLRLTKDTICLWSSCTLRLSALQDYCYFNILSSSCLKKTPNPDEPKLYPPGCSLVCSSVTKPTQPKLHCNISLRVTKSVACCAPNAEQWVSEGRLWAPSKHNSQKTGSSQLVRIQILYEMTFVFLIKKTPPNNKVRKNHPKANPLWIGFFKTAQYPKALGCFRKIFCFSD